MSILVLMICRLASLTLFIFAIQTLALAQGKNTVSGRVADAGTRQFLPFTSVSVLTSDSTLLTGAISDEEGRFTIAGLPNGNFVLSVSFIGYAPQRIPVLLGQLNDYYDIGTVALQASHTQLDEVVVAAQREMVSSGLDKKSFSVDQTLSQSGGSVLDVMKTMPGVTVDQEGKVVLRGSDKVLVLIDGKQSSLTGFGNQKALSNIPAANIERIEIINNPSAKYDASGMAGVINIIYKKQKEEGLNGDVGITVGLGAFTAPFREDLPTDLGSYDNNPKLIPSVNLNYKKAKFNYFLQSQAIVQRALPNNEFTIRKYSDGRNIISQVPENRKQHHYILNGGVDWIKDENNTFTLSAMYDWEQHTDTAQVAYIDQDLHSRYRYYTWHEDEITGYLNFTLQYHRKFKQPGHELTASVQYTRGWEDETYFLNDSSEVRIGNDKTSILAIEHTTLMSVDYVKPLRAGRMEAGGKVRIRRLPVTYEIERGDNSIIYPDLGDHSRWGENLYALYVNYVLERRSYEVEGGLRAEETDVFYTLDPVNAYYPDNDAYDYFRLFPSLRFTLKINDAGRLSLFYNRRIDRPGEPELRIFPKYDDPELLKVGNPYLRPQFTESFEVAYKYSWKSGSAYVAGFHRNIDDPFMRIFSVDDASAKYDIINKIFQNTGHATNTGVEVVLTQDFGSYVKASGSVNLYNNHIDEYTGTILFPYERTFYLESSDDFTWDMKVNALIQIPNKIELQFTGVYYAPKNIQQGRQAERSSVDIGVKKTFLKGKGDITFSVTDIFYQFGIRQKINDPDFKAQYENNYETQIMRLGFKYKI